MGAGFLIPCVGGPLAVRDPDVYTALVTKTHLYRQNKSQLDGLNEQAVLMCIKGQLMFDLQERLKTL